MARMLYSPSVFTEVVRSNPFAESRTMTFALVTRLAFASLIVTCRSPVAEPWANTSTLLNRMMATSEINCDFRMRVSPFEVLGVQCGSDWRDEIKDSGELGQARIFVC